MIPRGPALLGPINELFLDTARLLSHPRHDMKDELKHS